jgi:capsular polysaccharide biosynthesis protein
MDARFDAVEFARYTLTRWRTVAVACAAAAVFALAVSFLLPWRYTAVSSVVIEPPAGMDSRGASAVSPVYLESLRTYELLAAGDSLFQEALNHFHIREKYAGKSIESLKRSVLLVSRPVNTRVIQISVTLDDARQARELAQYMAERTVAISRGIDEKSAAGAISQAQDLYDAAQARVNRAREQSAEFGKRFSGAGAARDLDSATELKQEAERDLARARQDLAALSAPKAPGEPEPDWKASQIRSEQARITDLEKQVAGLTSSVARSGSLSDQMEERRQYLDNELKSAWASFDAASRKLDDLKALVAFQGERLVVLDPGIVPERPSSPNIPVNVLAAVVLALIGSIAVLAAQFGMARRTAWTRDYSLR